MESSEHHEFGIEDEYNISVGDNIVKVTPQIKESSDFNCLRYLREFDDFNLDESRSTATTCTIADPKEQMFSIDIVVITTVDPNGTEKRLLFIENWHVAPIFRGRGIGGQLQDIAENIAISSNCSTIFSVIAPEFDIFLTGLKQSKIKRGYELRPFHSNAFVAIKHF